jgi:hypothetical protein
MKRIVALAVVALLALSLGACSKAKSGAEAALKSAEEALNAGKAEAMKYIPDQVKSAEDALRQAKELFGKGDYAAATSAAGAVAASAKELAAAAAAKKDELTKGWEEQSKLVPNMIDAIRSRIEILSKSKKLPADLDQAKFDGAKSGLEEITKAWEEADGAFKSGALADAAAKAKSVKEKAVEIMNTLGMQLPEAAKS